MKCVILGGGGFIGSAIAERFLNEGHTLRVFERPGWEPRRDTPSGIEWCTGDFSSQADVSRAIEGMDVVIHLVSTTLPKSSNDDPVYDVQSNVVSTLQLLNAMVAQQVKRILFISSGGTVYGVPQYLPIDESHPTEPKVSYGITKLAIEKYLQMYEHLHGIKTTILRVANPYGERQRIETAQGAVGVFLHRALSGEPVEIWGDGSVTRDYIYIQDVAEAFIKALEYTGPRTVFNIGSGHGTSLNALLSELEAALGFPIPRRYLTARAFDVPVSVLDNTLAQQELGWMPKTSLREGIARTAKWVREARNVQ
jgi:Nucleoside-diphosphate-sugar epimerases